MRSSISIVVVLALLSAACVNPKDRRPGLRLRGEVATEAVRDWSFSDEAQEIHLETRTWYGLRHSVTTVCAHAQGRLYVPSVYFQGGAWPDKFWNQRVEADPRVRLSIGGRLYERRAAIVDDPNEQRIAMEGFALKYPFWRDMLSKPESERPKIAIVRMDPPIR